MSSPQFSAAFKRAVFLGVVSAAIAAAAWAAADPRFAVYGAIATAFLMRFVAEGKYDTDRDNAGDVREGDVGSSFPTEGI